MSSVTKIKPGIFQVRRADRQYRRVIPRRIPFVRPFAHIDLGQVFWMKNEAFAHSGLSEYDSCWTGEMARRPIPFVSFDPKPLLAQQKFEKYIGHVLNFLLPHMEPAIQAINKISSLGYPVFGNPGDGLDENGAQSKPSKFDVVCEWFQDMQAGHFDTFADGVHTIGVRKQNEPPTKERVMQFINDEGVAYEDTVDAISREIFVPGVGTCVGSRTRTIVRPPVVNLWLQCFDTLLHNTLLRHPLFDSAVYSDTSWPSDSKFVTFDCKHYERYLGLCAISYAKAIGGRYEQELMQLIHYPFIVPSDNWRTVWEVTPQYGPGIYPQFSSGLSPVAPLGKLTNVCVQVAYFHEVKKQGIASAIATVFSGVSDNLRRWSYGDDNRLLGSKHEIDSFCSYLGEFLDIEIDEKPIYLGFIFRSDLGKWLLPAKTYNLKLYQPERDFDWKDYPNLGLVERRLTFTRYGEPEIGADIIPFEDDLWNDIGHPFLEIAALAIAERNKAKRKGVELDKFMVSDKEYLMNDQTKVASGLFWHFTPPVVATIVNSLVSDRIRNQLSFRDARFTPVPAPKLRDNPIIEKDGDDEQENEI